jgi:hypothetical protein
VAPPDAYDPERIRAALRGSHGPSDRGARGVTKQAGPRRIEPEIPAPAEPRVPESPASWNDGTSWDQTTHWDAERSTEQGAGAQPGTSTSWDGFQRDAGAGAQPGTSTSWDGFQRDAGAGAQPGTGTSWDGFQRDAGARWDGATTDLTSTSANGNHHASQPGNGSSHAAVSDAPDAARADAIRRDPFSADWLRDREPTPAPATESGRPAEIVDEPSAADPDSWFTPRERPDRERTWDAEPSPGAAEAWFTPRERADTGLTPPPPAEPPQEHAGPATTELITGFWTPSAASAPREVLRPGLPSADKPAIPRASWPAPAETPTSDPPGAADRTMPILAQAATAAPSRTISGPAVPPGPVVPPGRSRSDRLYPVRLLVVIVVAALIGSILVLLLR